MCLRDLKGFLGQAWNVACRIQPCRIGECSSFSIQSSGIEFLGVVLLESLVLLHECQYRILCFGKPSLFFCWKTWQSPLKTCFLCGCLVPGLGRCDRIRNSWGHRPWRWVRSRYIAWQQWSLRSRKIKTFIRHNYFNLFHWSISHDLSKP